MANELAVGDFAQRNPATRISNKLDEYDRERFIGMITEPERALADGEFYIGWPSGFSVERGDHLLPCEIGEGMHVESIAPIQAWARDRNFPLLGLPKNGRHVPLLALNDNEVMGEISVTQVGKKPLSFQITTCVGRMILDESWADTESMPECLDASARLIHDRVRADDRSSKWGFAFGSLQDCQFVPD